MRKRIAWTLVVGLALGATANTVFADDDPPPVRKGRESGWAGPLKEWNKPAPKPKPKKEEPTPPPKPTVADKVQAARYKEQADLLRRMAICDKLMEIAVKNNDSELMRRVEQLQERANNVFSEHTVLLARTVEATNSAASIAQADTDKLLEKKDKSKAYASRGEKP
jgi:hypothetical protein